MAEPTNLEIRTELLCLYPEFTPAPPSDPTQLARIDKFIDRSKRFLNYDFLGDMFLDLSVLWTAHSLTVGQPKDHTSGMVSEEEDRGDNKTEYVEPDLAKFGVYGLTKYSREFKILLDTIPVCHSFIIC